MPLCERNCRTNAYNSIFEVDYPPSARNYLEIIKITGKHCYDYAMSLMIIIILVPDLENTEEREVISIGKMETVLNCPCLTHCVQCACCLLPLFPVRRARYQAINITRI